MPILIPDSPQGTTSPAVARLFRLLKKLPDDFVIWHQYQPQSPHFLIVSPGPKAFLIHVAETSEALAQSALQLDLLDSSRSLTPDELGQEELDLLTNFPIDPGTSVQRLVVFPNASQGTLDQVLLQRSEETSAHFLGLHQSRPDDFLAMLEKLSGDRLAEAALRKLRARFTPESVIANLHRPTLIEREKALNPGPAFLDLDQEKLFKQDLLKPPPGEELSSTSRLVTGPAGSGKSLVLLHRALLAAKLHPESRLLILTHNKPINRQLQDRFSALVPGRAVVQWRTFFAWATSHLQIEARIIGDHESRRRIAALQATRPELAGHHPGFLADEINYLRDLGVTTLADYLPLERTGRLTPLQDKSREAIWELLTTYRRQLSKDKLLDWHEVALTFYELSRTSPERLGPGFDFIFIDEAQFFAKIWFPPVLAALKASGQLFLSADQTQGFLKRRQSWRDLGIDVIGRAHRLSRVYRSTRPIAEAARCFFEARTTASHPALPEDLPDLMHAENLADLPDGEPVHLFAIASPGAARQKAAELVHRQLERTPHLAGQILVIEPEQVGLAAALRSHLKSPRVHDLQAGRRDPAPNSPLCLASSLHAATGLEATSVLLLGLDSLLEKEDDPTLSPLEKEELRAMHTRLIYVALTRAVCRLSIVTTRADRWRELLGLPPLEA